MLDAPSVASLTHRQLTTLLTVVGSFHPFCIEPDEQKFQAGEQMFRSAPAVDGESRALAFSVLHHACSRIEKILNDEERWTTVEADKMTQFRDEVLDSQMKLTRAQADLATAELGRMWARGSSVQKPEPPKPNRTQPPAEDLL